jgi:GWxTD domain-containing protein
MKRLLVVLGLFLVVQTGNAIEASVSWFLFKESKHYAEMHLFVIGGSLRANVNRDSMKSVSLDVTILFYKKDQIAKFDRYTLNSPQARLLKDFVDIKRYGLDTGSYKVVVELTDAFDSTNTTSITSELLVPEITQAVSMSSLALLSGFKKDTSNHPLTKYGYLMEPLPEQFYNKHASKLHLYNEVYNSESQFPNGFTMRMVIEKSDPRAADPKILKVLNRKYPPKPTNICLNSMDISSIPSGNYYLNVELRDDKDQLVLSNKVLFRRSNPGLEIQLSSQEAAVSFVANLSLDTLTYCMKALLPTLTDNDGLLCKSILEDKANVESRKTFVYRYFTNKSPNQPEVVYRKFMDIAYAVDKEFYAGFRRGFETDRGWMYMKYGRPDDKVTVETEPSAPPYEIWIYARLERTGQQNVRFLFYNPSLAGNNFVLLHSTARGEINNPNWVQDLYRDAQSVDEFGTNVDFDGLNRNAVRYFNDY